jgi:hypothetical protein
VKIKFGRNFLVKKNFVFFKEKVIFFPDMVPFYFLFLSWKCIFVEGKKHREGGKQKQDHDKYRSKKTETENMSGAENSDNNFVSDQQ